MQALPPELERLRTMSSPKTRYDLHPVAVVESTHIEGADSLLSVEAQANLRENGRLIVDFGEEAVGQFRIDGLAEGAGELIASYGEDLEEARRTKDFTCGWYKHPQDRLRVGPGAFSVVTPGRRAGRYLALRLETGRLQLHRIVFEARHYELSQRGRFACSDPQLEAIWSISERTTRLCMQEFYEDGIKRDGLLWIGDYRVQYLCNAWLYGDSFLAAKSLAMMATAQEDDGLLPACASKGGGHQHPDNINYMPGVPHNSVDKWMLLNYSADFVSGILEYLWHSGDLETARHLWPFALRTARRLCVVPEAETPGHPWITDNPNPDEPAGWWPSRGALDYQRLWAVRDARTLATLIGKAPEGLPSEKDLGVLIEGLLRRYAGQAYLLDVGDRHKRNRHMNAMAVLSGSVQEQEARSILRAVADDSAAKRPTSGFMEYWWLSACVQANLRSLALSELRRYWGLMVNNNANTCWEICHPDEKGIRRFETHALSHCHGWSAGPVVLLPRILLGIEPLSPGWRKVRIAPDLHDLEWAEVDIPTPQGWLHVRAERGKGESVHLDIATPPNVTPIQEENA